MPFWRKKRNMVRSVNLPEFYSEDFCTAGAYDLEVVTARQIFDNTCLFNNATAGELLYVYGINIVEDFGVCATIWEFKGHVGTLFQPGQQVRFAQGTPIGVTYLDQQHFPATPALDDPGPPAGSVFLTSISSGNQGGNIFIAPYPLFVIDPGYSLLVHVAMGCQQMAVGFWYQVAKPA